MKSDHSEKDIDKAFCKKRQYLGYHSIITFALRGEGGPSNCKHIRTGGGSCHINANVSYKFF